MSSNERNKRRRAALPAGSCKGCYGKRKIILGRKLCRVCILSGYKTKDDCKRRVFEHYGLECKQCGESRYDALNIDHINDDGHVERQITRGGHTEYLKIIRDGFPDDRQTLCANCNQIKRIQHQRNRRTA